LLTFQLLFTYTLLDNMEQATIFIIKDDDDELVNLNKGIDTKIVADAKADEELYEPKQVTPPPTSESKSSAGKYNTSRAINEIIAWNTKNNDKDAARLKLLQQAFANEPSYADIIKLARLNIELQTEIKIHESTQELIRSFKKTNAIVEMAKYLMSEDN